MREGREGRESRWARVKVFTGLVVAFAVTLAVVVGNRHRGVPASRVRALLDYQPP